MDGATLAGWIVALATLGILVLTMIYRGHDVGERQLEEKLKPLRDQQERFAKYHKDHFERSAGIDRSVATVGQALDDHAKHDDARFDELKDMQTEIRDDIKTILRNMPRS